MLLLQQRSRRRRKDSGAYRNSFSICQFVNNTNRPTGNQTQTAMLDASNRLKAAIKSKKPDLEASDVDGAIPVSISVDGTWQKRGYSSKLGVVFVIAVETGKILDGEVLSLFCQECNVNEKFLGKIKSL